MESSYQVSRVRFRLSDFMESLYSALQDNPSEIDDVIQGYKDFISRVDEPLLSKVKSYVRNHWVYTQNKRVESFISACYR